MIAIRVALNGKCLQRLSAIEQEIQMRRDRIPNSMHKHLKHGELMNDHDQSTSSVDFTMHRRVNKLKRNQKRKTFNFQTLIELKVHMIFSAKIKPFGNSMKSVHTSLPTNADTIFTLLAGTLSTSILHRVHAETFHWSEWKLFLIY